MGKIRAALFTAISTVVIAFLAIALGAAFLDDPGGAADLVDRGWELAKDFGSAAKKFGEELG